MKKIVGVLLALLLVAGGLLVLGAIVRFSIISGFRTRGAKSRLRSADRIGVQRLCGFELPPEIEDLYRQDTFVNLIEFQLRDDSRTPAAVWEIGEFIPLTPLDVREWQRITGVPDVPIATDMDKGVYVLKAGGAVYHYAPHLAADDQQVAPDIGSFRSFRVQEEGVSD